MQDSLFVLYTNSKNESLIQQNKNILSQLFSAESLLIWQKYKTFFGFNESKFKTDIANLSNAKQVKNIYLPINSSSVKLHKKLKKIYPKSNFFLYEEGLLSYIKPVFNKKLQKLLMAYESFFVGYDLLNNYLSHFLAKAKINIISKAHLLQAIDIVKINQPILQNTDKKYCLILPQYYYLSSKKKFAKLIELYKIEIENLKKLGYSVLIKEHPKAKQQISTLLSGVEVLNTNSPAIIEQIMPNLKINLVFSVYSTCLLSLSYFFGLNAITSKAMLKQRINYYSFYPTLSALLINNLFNSLSCGIINHKKEVKISDFFKSKSRLFNFLIYIKATI